MSKEVSVASPDPTLLKEEVKELIKKQKELRGKEEIQREKSWQNVKILWYSVGPFVRSGYGVVTNNFVSRLLQRGITTIIAAYYGLEPGGFIKMGDMIVLPVEKFQEDKLGFRSALQHMKKFQCDILIYMTDFWPSKPLADSCPTAACYSPIDHENYPEDRQEVFRKYKWVASPSLHGQKEVKKYQVDCAYVPHGVDTRVYYPIDKDQARAFFNIPKDAFVVGMVAANNDKEPRKGWDKMFAAIKLFIDQNPDARKDLKVFVHTNAIDSKGFNLHELAKTLEIGQYFMFQDPYMTVIGLPDQMMRNVYNSFDVMMNLSKREGFALTMEEANACGIPGIGTNFSSMPERLLNPKCGWLVKPQGFHFSPLNAITAIPDEYGACDALEEAYNKENLRKKYSRNAVIHAKQFDWNVVTDKYMLPWVKEMAESLPKFGGLTVEQKKEKEFRDLFERIKEKRQVDDT